MILYVYIEIKKKFFFGLKENKITKWIYYSNHRWDYKIIFTFILYSIYIKFVANINMFLFETII